MVFETNILFLLSASILNIEHTDQISSPASKQPIENLKNDSREHAQLRERVWQCQEHLGNLQNIVMWFYNFFFFLICSTNLR